MIEASQTEVVAMSGSKHSLMGEEGQRIRFNQLADLFNTVAVADQFIRRVHIHTIVACIFNGALAMRT